MHVTFPNLHVSKMITAPSSTMVNGWADTQVGRLNGAPKNERDTERKERPKERERAGEAVTENALK